MDRLEAMRVLLAVVDGGSLSAAGRHLGMPLATVSRKISELEGDLNTRLLIRSTRQLTMTESGRGYVDACRRILADVDDAERAASGEYVAPRGELIITAPVVFGRLQIVPILVEFLRAYPDVNVRLELQDRIVNLLEDQMDVALRIGTLPDSGLIATHLGNVRRVLCASPAYLRTAGIPIAPSDLNSHECISFEPFAPGNVWRFQVDRADVGIAIRPRLVVSTAEAAIDAASAGFGVASVLSYQIESALRAGSLRLILESFEPPPLPVSFLYSSQGRVPLKLRALLDFAAPRLRNRLLQTEATLGRRDT
jgi:DNA-binding transcriptional LysR family regulator